MVFGQPSFQLLAELLDVCHSQLNAGAFSVEVAVTINGAFAEVDAAHHLGVNFQCITADVLVDDFIQQIFFCLFNYFQVCPVVDVGFAIRPANVVRVIAFGAAIMALHNAFNVPRIVGVVLVVILARFLDHHFGAVFQSLCHFILLWIGW